MKRPSFQFYPGDWLNDAALRMVSVGARGLWIDMLCIMHQGSEYGYLKVNNKVILNSNLSRMVGSTLSEVEGWLSELNDAGVYSIDESGCIHSRRMIRDEEIRKARAEGGFKGGNPNLKSKNKVNLKPNLNPTPSSSSSSSSSSSIKEINKDNDFETFWLNYPKKKNKGTALKAWKTKKPRLDDVLFALSWQRESMDWIKDGGKFIPYPASYLNAEGWKDEEPANSGALF